MKGFPPANLTQGGQRGFQDNLEASCFLGCGTLPVMAMKRKTTEAPEASETETEAAPEEAAPVSAEAELQLAAEHLERIRKADSDALRAVLPTLDAPYQAAVIEELARREAAAAEARKGDAPMAMFKVTRDQLMFRDGFRSKLAAGSYVDAPEAERLKAMNIELQPVLVRLTKNHFGQPVMVEVSE